MNIKPIQAKPFFKSIFKNQRVASLHDFLIKKLALFWLVSLSSQKFLAEAKPSWFFVKPDSSQEKSCSSQASMAWSTPILNEFGNFLIKIWNTNEMNPIWSFSFFVLNYSGSQIVFQKKMLAGLPTITFEINLKCWKVMYCCYKFTIFCEMKIYYIYSWGIKGFNKTLIYDVKLP